VGADGPVTAEGYIVPDVAALGEAEAENRHCRDLLEDVAETIPVALARLDTDCVQRWINRHGAERLRPSRAQIVGRSMGEIFGDRDWSPTLEPRCTGGSPERRSPTTCGRGCAPAETMHAS